MSSSTTTSSSSSSAAAAVECQRFFAFSKRVPKDVKRFCGICRQHGKLEETRGHNCEFKDCECQKCNLVRSRRLVMSQQIRLRRAQDKRFQRTTEPEEADVVPLITTTTSLKREEQQPEVMPAMVPQQQLLDAKNMCYFCQKCKNHGILVWKKHHKRQCPFTECTCDFCELIETRRRLDQHIKRRKSAPQGNGTNSSREAGEEEDGVEEEMPPRKKSNASLPANIEAIAMLGENNGSSASGSPLAANFENFFSFGGHQQQLGSEQPQQSPLDALAAQLSRIQRESPPQDASHSPLTGTSTPTVGAHQQPQQRVSGASSPLQQQQQMQLLSAPLLLASSPASVSPSSSACSSIAAHPQQAIIPPQPLFTGPVPNNNGLLEQMLLLQPLLAQTVPSPSSSSSGIVDNASLIDLLLSHMLIGGALPQPFSAVPKESEDQQTEAQRELLLQLIGKLLHEQQQQQQNEQMLMLQQMQAEQQKAMEMLASAHTQQPQQLHQQHPMLDHSLAALLVQHNLLGGLLKEAGPVPVPPSGRHCPPLLPPMSVVSGSGSGTAQPTATSAFTALQHNGGGGFQFF